MSSTGPSTMRTLATLLVFAVVMVIFLAAIGGGGGSTELAIWALLVLGGAGLIVGRHLRARSSTHH